jgi:hypothetical protein
VYRVKTAITAGVAVAIVAGLLVAGAAFAQQGPPGPRGPQCQGVLSTQADAVVAKYRERAQAARDGLMKEERALFALLIADNSTRAAVDAQTAKVNDARAVFAKVRLDMLWELRTVIPAQNRTQGFRCAEFSLIRRR